MNHFFFQLHVSKFRPYRKVIASLRQKKTFDGKFLAKVCELDILFSSNHKTVIKCGLCFWASDPFLLIDFTKHFSSKCLKPKHKGHTNFYECCDLTKKVYLM